MGANKNKSYFKIGFLIVTAFFFLCCTPAPPPPTGWPVDPSNNAREIGNSAGEFQKYGADPPYVHTGVDIMFALAYPDPNSPDLIAVRDGSLWFFRDVTNRPKYHSLMLDVDDIRYKYVHVDEASVQALWGTSFINGGQGAAISVMAGDEVGNVVQWSTCNFHHIHFKISDMSETNLFNPLLYLNPKNDTSSPVIGQIRFFSQNNPAHQFTSGMPLEVNDEVDIVAEISDTINSGHNTGIYYFSCTIKNTTDPSIEISFSYSFDIVHRNEDVEIYRESDCSSAYCSGETYHYIVTNIDDGEINDGFWDTTDFPDGTYDVKIEAKDVSGNSGDKTVQVEVKNN